MNHLEFIEKNQHKIVNIQLEMERDMVVYEYDRYTHEPLYKPSDYINYSVIYVFRDYKEKFYITKSEYDDLFEIIEKNQHNESNLFINEKIYKRLNQLIKILNTNRFMLSQEDLNVLFEEYPNIMSNISKMLKKEYRDIRKDGITKSDLELAINQVI